MPYPILPYDYLLSYRAETFCSQPGHRLHTREEAIEFVNRRGFIFFWPIHDIPLPSLWVAVAGDRPVADEHDDPGHVSWGWKDSLLGLRQWYYAKVLRKRSTIIANELAPYFYALSENYGSPEEDYLTLYEQGRLTQEAKVIYEVLLAEGSLDSIALRRAAHMSGRGGDTRFNRALTDLQVDFKIMPIAVTQAGSWHYAYAYDLVSRHYPELLDQARLIGEGQARQKLSEVYFRSLGASRLSDLAKLFGWSQASATRTINELISQGKLSGPFQIENLPGEWV